MWTRLSSSKCGWAFSSVTRPCVAQRVWPMPVVAGGADGGQLPLGLHGDARGVVSAVLELLEPGEEDLLHRPMADIADDAAHGGASFRRAYVNACGPPEQRPAGRSSLARAPRTGDWTFVYSPVQQPATPGICRT